MSGPIAAATRRRRARRSRTATGLASGGAPSRAWRWYAGANVLVIVAYLVWTHVRSGDLNPVRELLYAGAFVASIVAVTVGIRRNRPTNAAAWRLILAGLVLYLVAESVFYVEQVLLDQRAIPSFDDIFYLLSYPVQMAGLLLLVHGQSTRVDRASLLDGVILTTGLTLVIWSVAVSPLISVPGQSLATRATLAVYPVLNLLMLSIAIRLAIESRPRPPAFWLLVMGLAALGVSDTVYALLELAGQYRVGHPIDLGWLLWFGAWGTAALHPSMRMLGEPTPVPAAALNTSRIVVLVGVALFTPTVLAVQAAGGHPVQLPVLIAGVAVLLVTVSARIKGLAAEVTAQAAARRVLLDQAVRASEDERVRIAADLHDGPIQRLTSLGYTIELSRRRLARGEAVTPEAVLGDLARSVVGEVAALRSLMVHLRPPVLDQYGLHAALRQCADTLHERAGTSCTVAITATRDLDTTQETVLYRVAQEALANVAKHAGAEHALVLLGNAPEGTRLEVRDDGRGFDPAAAAKLITTQHFGLAGMRERVEMAGGAWLLRTRPGEGTTIVATLPPASRS